jgi:hypothetical protein
VGPRCDVRAPVARIADAEFIELERLVGGEQADLARGERGVGHVLISPPPRNTLRPVATPLDATSLTSASTPPTRLWNGTPSCHSHASTLHAHCFVDWHVQAWFSSPSVTSNSDRRGVAAGDVASERKSSSLRGPSRPRRAATVPDRAPSIACWPEAHTVVVTSGWCISRARADVFPAEITEDHKRWFVLLKKPV